MADADRGQFDHRSLFDAGDHLAQMALEIIAGIDRQGRIVHRRSVRDHHQDFPLLRPRHQPIMRPEQRLAVDVLLEDAFAQHEAKALARAAPGLLG